MQGAAPQDVPETPRGGVNRPRKPTERSDVLIYVDIRVDPKGMTNEELWEVWEEETKAALGAMEAGKVVSLYKVTGQKRVLAIMNVESHDELDQILMAGLPMAEYLEYDEVLPIREYTSFAEDIRSSWGQREAT